MLDVPGAYGPEVVWLTYRGTFNVPLKDSPPHPTTPPPIGPLQRPVGPTAGPTAYAMPPMCHASQPACQPAVPLVNGREFFFKRGTMAP